MKQPTPTSSSNSSTLYVNPVYVVLLHAIVLLILIFVPSAIVSFAFGVIYDYSDLFAQATNANNWFAQIETQILLMAFSLPFTVLMVWLFAQKLRPVLSDCSTVNQYLGIHRTAWNSVCKWAVISIIFWCLLTGITSLMALPEEPFMQQVKDANVPPALLFLVICILAPLAEELIFRGLIFTGLVHSRLGTIGAGTISCLLFTAIHFQQYSLIGLSIVLIIAIFLTLIRIKTKSLVPCIVAHSSVNSMTLGTLFLLS